MRIVIGFLTLVAATALFALSRMGPEPMQRMAQACNGIGASLEIEARDEPVCKTPDGYIKPIPAS